MEWARRIKSTRCEIAGGSRVAAYDWLFGATPSTLGGSPTARNLRVGGRARLTIGSTRDVVLIEGTAVVADGITGEVADAFATKTGFDPREQRNYPYFRIRPQLIQAWREVNEIAERDLMVGGEWLT